MPTHDLTNETGLLAFWDQIFRFFGSEGMDVVQSTISPEGENYKVEFEFRPIEMKGSITKKAA